MGTNNQQNYRGGKGLSAFIWVLAILAVALFIVSIILLGGFVSRLSIQAQPQYTVPDFDDPMPDFGEEWPFDFPQNTPFAEPAPLEPAPTMDPEVRENLPELELSVQPSADMQTFASIPDVVEAASGSVVGILQYQKNSRTGEMGEYASGSGFIVSEDGYVLTNAHVISGAAQVDVLFSDGRKLTALVVGTDITTDVAVLKIEAEGLTPLPMGDSSALRVGEYVIAIGNPLNAYEFHGTVTFGIISATARDINIEGFVNTYLQTDAAINFGNSGGPLINMHGQVIGMNTAKSVTAGYDAMGNSISAEGIGFALPIQNVMEIVNTILREGNLTRPGIGIIIRPINEQLAAMYDMPTGCRVESVTVGGPAEKAGLLVGDVIMEADGKAVQENDDVVNYIRSLQVGDVVTFTVYRDGETLTIPVTVGDMNQFSK